MKIKSILFLCFALVQTLQVKSQETKKQADIKAIKSMCGCYEVKFNFTETFEYAKDSSKYKPSPTKHETALEWIELVEDQPNKIVLQHLLIVGKKDTDIIKHWRQDWLFENTELYSFFKDRTWNFKRLNAKDVKGQWTQKIYQVDDSPRYEGTATWIHADGTSFWRNTADAPLPRREHTIRDDYNVLKRRNLHEVTSWGWIHDQDNDKLIRDDKGNDVLLAQEKGYDTYTKVEDSKCANAKNYWAKDNGIWKKVRTKWEALLQKDKTISLLKTVDGKPLYSHLFELKPESTQAEVDAIIDRFIVQ